MSGRYLSFHKYQDYAECPLRWKWKYVDQRPVTDLDKPTNKLLGIVWNDMLEAFYRDRKFLLGPNCSAWMREAVGKAFAERATELGVIWSPPEQESAFLAEALEVIPKILDCLRLEKLLGDTMEVEKTLYAALPSGNRIGGRLDLILSKGENYKVVDFKGTKHPKTLQDAQLLWYGLLFQGEHKVFPDHLGYWLLRFGCVKWVAFSKVKVKDFIYAVETAFQGIQDEKFEATPGSKACKYCPYRSGCDAWTKYQAEHRRPSKIPDGPDGFSEVLYLDE